MVQRDRYRQLLGVASLPLGAVVVHQLRHLLAYGSGTPDELAARGHGCLSALTPWIMPVVALGQAPSCTP